MLWPEEVRPWGRSCHVSYPPSPHSSVDAQWTAWQIMKLSTMLTVLCCLTYVLLPTMSYANLSLHILRHCRSPALISGLAGGSARATAGSLVCTCDVDGWAYHGAAVITWGRSPPFEADRGLPLSRDSSMASSSRFSCMRGVASCHSMPTASLT